MVTAGGAHEARHRTLLIGQLAAVILGILGMHALAQHCPTSAHAMQPTATMASGAMVAAVTHGHAAVGHATTDAQLATVIAAATGTASGSLGDMLMLCAAMLLGAGAVLTLILRRRHMSAHVLLRRRPMPHRRPRLTRLPRAGPSTSMAFSVIRC